MDVTTRPRAGTSRLALLAAAHLIISIDYNIVYVALPRIGHDLGFSAQSLQWVISAYAVGFGGLLLLGGRAVDRLGARRIFLAGVAGFGLASLAGGLAAGPGVLVAARVGQGLSAALLFPATLKLINTGFPAGPRRTRALAMWGVAGGCGAVVGPVAGGVLTSALGWEWVFFVNVPVTSAVALAAAYLLPGDAAPAGGGFDLRGAAIATAGATLLVFGLVSGPDRGWASARGGGSLIAGAVLLVTLVLVERRTRDPLLPPRMLRVPALVAAMVLGFLFTGLLTSAHYMFFVHLQGVLGYGALAAGLTFLPMSVFAMIGSWTLLPWLLDRWGLRTTLLTVMVGGGLAIVALVAGMSPDGAAWMLLPGIAALGLVVGAAYPAIYAAAASGVSTAAQGVATAMTSTAQQIGGALGLAALVAVATVGLDPGAAAAQVAGGLRTGGLVAAAVAVAGAVAALLVPAPPRAGLPRHPGRGARWRRRSGHGSRHPTGSGEVARSASVRR